MNKIVLGFVLALPMLVNAAPVSLYATLKNLYTYQNDGVQDGRVVIEVMPESGESLSETCGAGFWMNSTEENQYNTTISFLLSAFHTKQKIWIRGDDSHIWNGSSTANYCRLTTVGLIQ